MEVKEKKFISIIIVRKLEYYMFFDRINVLFVFSHAVKLLFVKTYQFRKNVSE